MKTNINLLDLDNDILNIIGGYVKHDNNRRIRKEHNFNETDFIINRLKRKNNFIKKEIGEAIYSQLFKNCHTKDEINEYIETRNLKNILLEK
jgi:hypothetical protein